VISKLNDTLSTRDNNFDLIRFVAAVAVIFSHSYDLTAHYDHEPLRVFSNGTSNCGELAVMVFFVTSGFLIAQSFVRTKSLKKYFAARLLRIYPGLLVVVLCSVFLIGPLLTSLSLREYFFNLTTIKYLFNSTSIKISFHLPGVFSTNPFPRDSVNGSLWSLPYELLCYVFVAIAGVWTQRRYFALAILCLVVCVFLPFMLLSTLLTFGFYFLSGSLLYLLRYHIPLHATLFLGAITVLILNLGYNNNEILQTFINGIALGYVVVFLAAYKLKAFQSFSKYGDFSYGLYLWAFPVQQIVASYPLGMDNRLNFFIGILITLVLAFISWHLVEKHALRLKAHPLISLSNRAVAKKKDLSRQVDQVLN
jgi:peptidoglycan/LPS O-acetylase OafA/YrhL